MEEIKAKGLGSLQCNVCSRVYSTKTYASYKSHIAKCGKQTLHQCSYCDKYLLNAATLKKHIKHQHTEGKLFKCYICDKAFGSRFTCTEHEKTHIEKECRQGDRLKCEKCDKTFLWKSSLSRHMQSHFTDGSMAYVCDCGLGFTQYSKLYTHKRDCNGCRKLNDKEKEGSVLIVCKCGIGFTQYNRLENHKRDCKVSRKVNDIMEKPAKVGVVIDENTTKENMAETRHTCQFCKRVFNDRAVLDVHIEACDEFNQYFPSPLEKKVVSGPADAEHNTNAKMPGGENVKKTFTDGEEESGILSEDETAFIRERNTTESTRERLRRKIKAPKRYLDEEDHNYAHNKGKSVSNSKKQNVLVEVETGETNKHSTADTVVGKRDSKPFIENSTKDTESPGGKKCRKSRKSRGSRSVDNEKTNKAYSNEKNEKRTSEMEEEPKSADKQKKVCQVSLPQVKSGEGNVRENNSVSSENADGPDIDMRKNVKIDEQSRIDNVDVQPVVNNELVHNADRIQVYTHVVIEEDTSPTQGGDIHSVGGDLSNVTFIVSTPVTCLESTKTNSTHSEGNQSLECASEATVDELPAEIVTPDSKVLEKKLSCFKRKKIKKKSAKGRKAANRVDDKETFHGDQLLRYKCKTKQCDKTFETLCGLARHKKKEHAENLQPQCLECSRTFSAGYVYKSHVRMKHLDLKVVNFGYKNVEICKLNSDGTLESAPIRKCTMCGLKLGDKDNYEQHVPDCQPRQLLFFCPFCVNKYPTFDECRAHIGEAHPEETSTVAPSHKYQSLKSKETEPAMLVREGDTLCKICQKDFTSCDELKVHMNVKHAAFPFSCGLCHISYGRRSAIQTHLLTHKAPLSCPYCGKVFNVKKYLERHINTHTGDRPYQCDVCGKRYCAENSVKKHLQQNHRDVYIERYQGTQAVIDMEATNQSGPAICHICGLSCLTARQFEIHLRQHDDKMALRCDLCAKKFSTGRSFSRHQMTHLMNVARKEVGETVVEVDGLDQQERTRLYQGMRVVDNSPHPSGKKLKCSMCAKRFRKTSALNQHIQSVHLTDNLKKCICLVCFRGFPRKNLLASHMRVHTNHRPYRCRICKRTYKQLAHIREHLRYHGKNQFVCQICGSEFKTRATLGNHAVTHCKIFPYTCPVDKCEQAFKDVPSLMSHVLKEKINGKSLVCNICKKSLHDKSEFVLHVQKHTKDELFPCSMCGAAFTTYKRLYFHKSHHRHVEQSEMELMKCIPSKQFKTTSFVEVSQDVELDILLTQYDFIGPDGKIVEKTRNSVESAVSDEDDNFNREPGEEEDELILIAEQLTHMAAGTEQMKELVISETSVNPLPDFEQIDASSAEAGTGDLYKTNSTSENIGYPSLIVHAESKSDTLQYTGGFHEEGNEEVTMSTLHFVVKDSQQMDNIAMVPSKERDQDSAEYVVCQDVPVPSLETFVDATVEAMDSTLDVLNETDENNVNMTENTHEYEESTDLSVVSTDIKPGVRVLDQQGNEVIICVVNEEGEQEKVADGQEVIRSVLATGKYEVEKQYQEISARPGHLHDMDNIPRNNDGLVVTDVYIIKEKDEVHEDGSGTGNRKTKKKKAKLKNNDGNIDKILGKLDTTLEPESDVKVSLNYYKDKSDAELYPFQCSDCSLRFINIKNLNNHKKTHLSQSERKYRCSLCPAGFNIPSALEVHARIHSGEKPFSCNKCDKTFRQRGHLLTHIRGHEGYRPFQCTHCDKRFISNNLLTRHVKINHSENKTYLSNTSCDVCGQVFPDSKSFRCHQLIHLDGKKLKKLLRKYNTSTSSTLEAVEAEDSSPDEADAEPVLHESKKDIFICDVCGLIFTNAASLSYHTMRHKDAFDAKCSQCDKTFANNQLLRVHQRNHRRGPVQCEICGKQLKYETSLARHMQKHNIVRERKYNCSKCKAGYMIESMFLKHIAVCLEDEIFTDVTGNTAGATDVTGETDVSLGQLKV